MNCPKCNSDQIAKDGWNNKKTKRRMYMKAKIQIYKDNFIIFSNQETGEMAGFYIKSDEEMEHIKTVLTIFDDDFDAQFEYWIEKETEN